MGGAAGGMIVIAGPDPAIHLFRERLMDARIKSAHDEIERRSFQMDATALRAMQAPIKDKYKTDAGAAMITLKAKGAIDENTLFSWLACCTS